MDFGYFVGTYQWLCIDHAYGNESTGTVRPGMYSIVDLTIDGDPSKFD